MSDHVPTSVVPTDPSPKERLFAWASAQIDKLQAKFPPNRVAVALGLVLAPLWAWLSQHGIKVPPALAITVLAAGATLLYKYIDGYQTHEERLFYGKPAPSEDSDRVEIARIEAGAKVQAALIERVDSFIAQELLLAAPDHADPAPQGPAGAVGGALAPVDVAPAPVVPPAPPAPQTAPTDPGSPEQPLASIPPAHSHPIPPAPVPAVPPAPPVAAPPVPAPGLPTAAPFPERMPPGM